MFGWMVKFPAARVDVILRRPAFGFLVNKDAVTVLEEELALVSCTARGWRRMFRGAYPYESNVHWLEEVELSDPEASDGLIFGPCCPEDFAIVLDVFQGDLSKRPTPFAAVNTKLKPPLPTGFAPRKTSSTRGVGYTII